MPSILLYFVVIVSALDGNPGPGQSPIAVDVLFNFNMGVYVPSISVSSNLSSDAIGELGALFINTNL